MPKFDNTKYPRIYLRVSQSEWIKFEKYREQGIPAREVLELSSCPCSHCKGIDIITYAKESGEQVKIPRGILSKKR